ncbi:MAG: hydrogenase nickel incorporation protein HypB [Acidobacteria bacterium]|nr:hydrogenase nickel incorporation protein HypB [Acidobacteriota bacterium]
MSLVTIERHVKAINDRAATDNRARLNESRPCAVNLLSAAGAGKTSLLESTIEQLQSRLRIAVIAGDTQTDFDARRLSRFSLPVVRVLMHGGCHLDAKLVERALDRLDEDPGLEALDLLIIENVDNLRCTVGVDLGEHLRAVVLSTAEGEAQPFWYPAALNVASALVINKTDLVPFARCDLAALKANALQVNPSLAVFETSCTSNTGIAEWGDWLARHIKIEG